MYLLTYKMYEASIDEVKQMIESLQKQFPQETFLAIPDSISLMECDKEQLTTIRNFIDTLLKNKEGED